MDPYRQLAITEQMPPDCPTETPVVVLVHGSLDRSASFARVLRRLEDLHTVVYDRRGYDQSREVPLGTTLDDQIDDLLGVIGGRQAVVIGHSYGGIIALGAALRSDPGTTIMSIAAYEPPFPWLPPSTEGSDTAHSQWVASEAGDEAEQFYRRVVGDMAWDRLSESSQSERRAEGPALVADMNAIRLSAPPFDITGMRIPVLFGRGEQSIPRHRAAVAWLVEHTPNAELIDIPGASHGAHLSHPGGFSDLVRLAME